MIGLLKLLDFLFEDFDLFLAYVELLLAFGELIVQELDFVLKLCLGFLHLECADD